MIYLKVIYNVIAVVCITYMIFNFMDVVSWIYVKSKNVVIGIFNLIKKWVQ